MSGIRIFMRLTPLLHIRWGLTVAAYICTFGSLVLNLVQPLLFSYLIDNVLIDKKTELLVPTMTIMVGCAIASVLFTLVRGGVFRYLGIRHTLDIRETMLRHLRKIPMPEIEKHGPGKFTALLGMDAAAMGNFVNHVLVELVSQFVVMSVAIIFLLYVDVWLGLMALVSIPLLLYIPILFKRPIERNVQICREHNEEIGTYLYEAIEGSREIRSFGLENWENERNRSLYIALVRASTRETLFRVLSGQIGAFVISMVMILLYWFGTHQVLDGTMTIGMLVASVTYLFNVLNPINAINSFYGELKQSEVALGRIEGFLETPLEAAATVDDLRRTLPFHQQSEIILSCKDVHVSYEGVNILQGLNLQIGRGQRIAFVGRSGSGKSSLFRTVMGFMQITSGEMRLGSKAMEDITRQELNEHISMVFQETHLFRGTIYENIIIGNLSATADEVNEAVRLANLGDLIDSLPDGIQTFIDHKGFQLSGGQRQRIGIARVLLRKPSVLILDEPTSALDRLSEEEVLVALKNLMRGKTTLMATHRLETIKEADLIYVLDKGRVVEAGNHASLMEQSGIYYSMIINSEMEEKEIVAV
ncbi:ABC transporter ATP-binding protein/permease [Paenibacillus oenotherae]|uniref:ABC transporter ATP-binding protein/permease n=1 Tax=Paenibacillus oenotherae TaxID=1435645 RepID=A0ABS7D9F0_9BACL|nr:ABC transporter ATP-binding protein [Paenibacillus oenotherae]MBW7476506.1 ABC transporter ATP-binding protein/permease [Paenibacillus oenotherae]